MVLAKIYFLPLAVFILLPGTFILTYVISILLRDVEVEFPYISDTGTYVPESCIFGQLLNLVASLIAATVYVRYKQVEQYYRDHLSNESRLVLRLNVVGLWLGCTAAFGVSLVANFQETSVFIVHMIGAMMAFGIGMLYAWLQTVMSYYMFPLVNSLLVARLRLVLSIVSTVCFIILNVATPISLKQFHGKDKTKWYPKDGGFASHVISTVSEWILALAFDLYFLSFVRELQNITMASPKVIFLTEETGMSSTSDIYHSEDNLEVAFPQSHGSMGSVATETVNSINSVTTEAIIHR
ncbi:DNA damage-regulated autophagy modulator protein 2-like [Limulus polyphemus]|uniref:DNA damage-regulated autophagy modulator protein 2-like n=1 Tax=Limulus polyphemus TaxID=6850 RepID=A0ABM1BRJ2_LIMPO|nr:DNA damage-regulated autophagy modulator protein 2-like [Limulus polyphemus]